MPPPSLRLSDDDRRHVDELRSKGMHPAREVNRAHILAALDRSLPQARIMEVLGVERTAIWSTRAAYLAGGVSLALHDVSRAGRPPRYSDADARLRALMTTAPPAGARRWTVQQLADAARAQPGLEGIGKETVRRLLKKISADRAEPLRN